MSLKGKRVLVTGADGFIGRHLVRRLLQEGAELREVGRAYHRWPEYDLRRREACEHAIIDQEIVYHCAGVTAGAGIVRGDPMALVPPNTVMAANMLDAAARAGVKTFIFPSSTTGYPEADHPVKEDEYHGALYEGYRAIGTVKRFIEDLAGMYPMTTVALRISNVFGPGDQFDPVRSHVTPATIRKVAERQNPITVWGDGNDVRDAVYIDDVVEAMVLAADLYDAHHAFNIGRGTGHTVSEILRILVYAENAQTETRYAPEVVYDTSKPTLLRSRLVNVERAKHVLGWEAKVSMEDGLARTLAWYKASLANK